MNKTSVEWLHEKLATSRLEDMQKNINLWFQQAKEMEKQQQGYSEEDVIRIAKLSYNKARIATGNSEVSFNIWFDTWFEQFKKK